MSTVRQLRVVPDVPRRGIGVIRVSKVGKRGEGLVSPEIQEHAILQYAAKAGIDVIDWVPAIDESGSSAKSAWWPKLDAQIERVERGEADVIVAWEYSRHARNRLRWAVALDRVEAAGGSLESATEPVDVTTASGRLHRGVLAEFHAYKAEAIGEGWKATHERRHRHGLPHNGSPRLGYRYDTETKSYSPDPETAPIVVELHRRYVAGEGLGALSKSLRDRGVLSPRTRKPWTHRGVAYLLDSGFAAGLLHVHDPDCQERHGRGAVCTNRVHIPGAHEAVVDTDLWAQVQAARASRATLPPRLVNPSTPLSGIVRCGTCGHRMAVHRQDGTTRFRCANRECLRPASVLYARAETALLDWLPTVSGILSERASAVHVGGPAAGAAERERAMRVAAEGQRALDNLTLDLARRVIPQASYERARAQLEQERDDALAVVRRLDKAAVVDRGYAEAAAGVLEAWGQADAADVGRLLRDLVVLIASRREDRRGCDVTPRGVWEDDA